MQHLCDFIIANGKIISSGAITHTICIFFALEAQTEFIELFVTRLDQYPVILSLPQLQKHDFHICFKENTITFDSKCCLNHWISTHQAMTICGAGIIFDTLHEISYEILCYLAIMI